MTSLRHPNLVSLQGVVLSPKVSTIQLLCLLRYTLFRYIRRKNGRNFEKYTLDAQNVIPIYYERMESYGSSRSSWRKEVSSTFFDREAVH